MNAIQLFLSRYGAVHADAEALLDGLTEEQVRSCPHPAVNSIAWLLWHMARVEDIGVSRFVAHQPQLAHQEGWLERLNVTRRDVGTAMGDDEVAELSGRIDIVGLREYWRALAARTTAIVQELRPEDLDETVDPVYARQVAAEDEMFSSGGSWVVQVLENRPRGVILAQMALTHHYGHLGEARVTRTLLGFRGR